MMQQRIQPSRLSRALAATAYIAIAAGLSIQGMLVQPAEPGAAASTPPCTAGPSRGLKAWSWEFADDDESFPARYEPRVPRATMGAPVEV